MPTPASAPTPPPAKPSLLQPLLVGLYVIFTLLPDSSTVVLAWPWVAIWQVFWLGWGVLWVMAALQRQPIGLGLWGDRLVRVGMIGALGLAIAATQPTQALWYTVPVLGAIAALSLLTPALRVAHQRDRWLRGQAIVSVMVAIESVWLWLTQTVLPEAQNQAVRRGLGLDAPYDFNVLELRNWAPFGHQNYVAGYLVLSLPIVILQACQARGRQRWIWTIAALLETFVLYTTSSRAGTLALGVMAFAAFGVWRTVATTPATPITPTTPVTPTTPQLPTTSRSRRLTVLSFGAIVVTMVGLVLTSQRLIRTIGQVLNGEGTGDLSFRVITIASGWAMGRDRWWFGQGLGSVPNLYQRYRPHWAGQEAEDLFQLHCTPIQLWAELGVWGALVWLGAIGLWVGLAWHWWQVCQSSRSPRSRNLDGTTPAPSSALQQGSGSESPQASLGSVLAAQPESQPEVQPEVQLEPSPEPPSEMLWTIGAILLALLGYGVVMLFDYQLDLVAIAGVLLLYVAVLVGFALPQPPMNADRQSSRPFNLALNPGLAAVSLTASLVILLPQLQAWQRSASGFDQLRMLEMEYAEQSAGTLAPESPAIDGADNGAINGDIDGGGDGANPPTGQTPIQTPITELNPPLFESAIADLQAAIRLAPQEAYYPLQLGWWLGEWGETTGQKTAIEQFQTAIARVPYQEFSYRNLGNLLLNSDPQAAQVQFENAIRLIPGKRGLFDRLAQSHFQQSLTEQRNPLNRQAAIMAWAIECLQNPQFLTSPQWFVLPNSEVYDDVLTQVADDLAQLFASLRSALASQSATIAPDQVRSLRTYLYQTQGWLAWWQGDIDHARQAWQAVNLDQSPLFQALLLLEQSPRRQDLAQIRASLQTLPDSSAKFLLLAWADPGDRLAHLQRSWLLAERAPLDPAQAEIWSAQLNAAPSFRAWLRTMPPVLQYRRQRAGFGVNRRHIDGFQPQDFDQVIENAAVARLLSPEIVPNAVYQPALSRAIAPLIHAFVDF